MRTPLDALMLGFKASLPGYGRNPLGGGDLGVGRGLPLVGGEFATYELLYEQQIWVHAVVNRLARGVSRLPWKAFVNPDEPHARERVREGPLAELLARPHPKGAAYLKQSIVSNVAIHGNCVAVKARERSGKPPKWLIPTSFAYWDVIERDGQVWYVYDPRNGTDRRQWYRPQEVVHFMWFATRRGLKAPSPLSAIRQTLAMEDAAQRHIIASFENGARPSGAFTVDGPLKEGAAERMKAQLQEIFGGVENAGKIALLEGGAKWQAMAHSLVDSEVVALRQLTREEVAAVYNMPPPSVGILDRATYSNISEQRLMENTDTLQPWTTMIEEALETQLIATEPGMADQYAEFDFGAVLAGDPVKQTQTLVQAVGGPYLTADEARALKNLPPMNTPESTTLRPPPNASIRPAGDDA